MPKPFLKSDFKVAVRDPSTGRVYTGKTHYDAINAAHADGILNLGMENTGFQHHDGTFYTRAETEREWGFKMSEDLL